MSIGQRETACFTVQCDICGKELDVESDVLRTHFKSADDARLALMESGWWTYRGEDWCWDENPACVCGDLLGDHEDYKEDDEEGCNTCDCERFVKDVGESREGKEA